MDLERDPDHHQSLITCHLTLNHTHIAKPTDRQTDKQTNRQTDKQAEVKAKPPSFGGDNNNTQHHTRKPCCRKETARCRSCSFRLKVRRQHSLQASKAMLQSSKGTGAKQNLTQNGHSRSFNVTCFGVSGKAIRC